MQLACFLEVMPHSYPAIASLKADDFAVVLDKRWFQLTQMAIAQEDGNAVLHQPAAVANARLLELQCWWKFLHFYHVVTP